MPESTAVVTGASQRSVPRRTPQTERIGAFSDGVFAVIITITGSDQIGVGPARQAVTECRQLDGSTPKPAQQWDPCRTLIKLQLFQQLNRGQLIVFPTLIIFEVSPNSG
jgi:hypothetical protein